MITSGGGRPLATVERITHIRPIPGADAIECARIRGWDVVVKKDEFQEGDLCVYIEVDTLVDVTDPRFTFLAARGVRTDAQGNAGHVLKTARLRGQYSQGLALPVQSLPELTASGSGELVAGRDVTDHLPLRRWDPPLPAGLAGQVHGRIPGWIPVTDEPRVENCPELLAVGGVAWVATEKIDGTSTTVYVDPSAEPGRQDGVCSRNYDLVHAPTQPQWALALQHQLHGSIRRQWPGARVAVQGETFGVGIQGNPLRVEGHRLALFTVRVDGAEVARSLWPQWVADLAVPILPGLSFPSTIEQAVAQADTAGSALASGRAAEGIVWRGWDTVTALLPDPEGRLVALRASFKAVSRRYLLKHDR